MMTHYEKDFVSVSNASVTDLLDERINNSQE